jgi:3-dehydroquinate synthase
MESIIQVNYEGKKCYDIVIGNDYSHFYKELQKLDTTNRKLCVVCDSNTAKYYRSEIVELVKDYANVVTTFTFPAGEESKNLDTVKKLYEHLIISKFDRNDILLAVGGGVVGDLVGYTAATYLRGIRFVQLPTTLLSMVDSSIGGKTGVDFDNFKNMVGAFHQPKSVYMNLVSLDTLPEEQFSSGMGEVIKYAFIKDASFYQWLKDNHESILKKDYDILKEMVYRSCSWKKVVVENDPLEKGERALLNFGHTIGHSVEKLMKFNLLHGQCVGVGMVAASYMSYRRGYITLQTLNDIIDLHRMFHLPVTIADLNPLDIVEATKHDKKMEAGKIKFILLKELGNAYIDDTVTDEEMLEAIAFLKQEISA